MSPGVLIVDDSLTVRMDLAEAVETCGLRAIPCATAAEARRALAAEDVDAVVLDLILPDASGVDVLREIRAMHGTAVPVLMLSSEADVPHRIEGLQTGADEYVGKPYDRQYVVARLRDLVRARRPRDPGSSTILLIEDSATFRHELASALRAAGHEVVAAPSGEEGLRLAATRRPDAVIVDGLLPGIDGATVIRRLRLDAALRDVPCVLLTASEGRQMELRALDAGADAFVRKGDDTDVVLARLAAALRWSAARPPRLDEAQAAGAKKVLAVDDSPTYLDALASSLQGEGYDVILARSGEEAIDLLAVQPVDCILLDLMMPGIGGRETCERIKAAPGLRDTPLIMLTARDDRDAMIAGLAAGADDYISKSSEIDVLQARVRAQVRRKQFEDENRRIREELLRKEHETAEAEAARRLAETRAALVEELQRANRELEAFSYSVSHDLRAPLRAIDGFSRMVLEDYGAVLDPKGQEYLQRVRAAAQRMGELIDDLLGLSRVGRAEIVRTRVDLSDLARRVAADLARRSSHRPDVRVQDGLAAEADARLMQILLENLLGNSWKFTGGTAAPRIEVCAEEGDAGRVFVVRDNGAGFDGRYAAKLFRPFQRLHSEREFPGTGIGLATVSRIVDRHGGRIWAEGAVGLGATISFTLPPPVRHGGSA